MKAATAKAVTGVENHLALTSGEVLLGKPTIDEKARFANVMDTLYEKKSGGKRNILWIAEQIQKAADGQGGEFLKEVRMLPDGRLPLDSAQLPIRYCSATNDLFTLKLVRADYSGTGSIDHPVGSLSWQGKSESTHSLSSILSNGVLKLEMNFARTMVQTIDNCPKPDNTLSVYRDMIVRSGLVPEGMKSFLACLYMTSDWPKFWKEIVKYDDKKRNVSPIVFVGDKIFVRGDGKWLVFYPGFGTSILRGTARDDLITPMPALFPAHGTVDAIRAGEIHFAFRAP